MASVTVKEESVEDDEELSCKAAEISTKEEFVDEAEEEACEAPDLSSSVIKEEFVEEGEEDEEEEEEVACQAPQMSSSTLKEEFMVEEDEVSCEAPEIASSTIKGEMIEEEMSSGAPNMASVNVEEELRRDEMSCEAPDMSLGTVGEGIIEDEMACETPEMALDTIKVEVLEETSCEVPEMAPDSIKESVITYECLEPQIPMECGTDDEHASDEPIPFDIHLDVDAYGCVFCNFRCERVAHMRIHMDFHIRGNPTQTNQSLYPYLLREFRLGMQSEKNSKRRFVCDKCTYSSLYEGVLKRHIMKHHQEKRHAYQSFGCGLCSLIGNNDGVEDRAHFLSHISLTPSAFTSSMSHLDQQPSTSTASFPIPSTSHLYQQPSTSTASFPTPSTSHLYEQPSTSTASFPTHRTRARGYRGRPITMRQEPSQPTTKQRYACHLCVYRSLSLSALKKHISLYHPEQRLYECDFCDDSFFCEESDLKNHLNNNHEVFDE